MLEKKKKMLRNLPFGAEYLIDSFPILLYVIDRVY